MSYTKEQELLQEVKSCKAAVIVLNDMSSICYGFPNCKSIDQIDTLGIIGVAFRSKDEYLHWFKKGEMCYVRNYPKEKIMNRIMHHSISNKTLKEVIN